MVFVAFVCFLILHQISAQQCSLLTSHALDFWTSHILKVGLAINGEIGVFTHSGSQTDGKRFIVLNSCKQFIILDLAILPGYNARSGYMQDNCTI